MKKTLLALFLSFAGLSVMAQSKFNISGTVLDSETSETILSASVRILSLPDSSMVAGAATGADGTFNIKSVKKGNYVVKVTYIGYQDKVIALNLNEKKGRDQSIGYITIVPDSKLLQEAEVTANAAQVQVSGDSLVYNASAYRVAEGSALEELVKKLPGAKVDDDGNITINGKTVSKIMLNGKEFFLNDTKVAMKNIPTNMIDKLKTYDRKSDFSRVTGIDDGEEETVLDLTVKKGMNNGWFGNFDAGIGTEERYAESLMLNRFVDNNQMTLIGGANNTGDRGFGGGGGRGWGRGGNGLMNTKNLGLNFATSTEKLEAGGNVRFRYDGSDVWNQSAVQSFVTSAGAFRNSESSRRSSQHEWNADFRFEWKPDSMTNIIFRPSGGLSRSKGYNNSESASFNADPNDVSSDPLDDAINHSEEVEGLLDMIVNTNVSRSQTYTDSRRLAGELQANRRLNNEGRNITFRATGNMSGSDSKQLSAAQIHYANSEVEDNINNRYYSTPGRNRAYSLQLTYSEPIATKTYLQFSYRYNFSYNKSDRQAFVMDAATYTDLANALNQYRYDIDGAIGFLVDNGHKLYGATEDEEANKLSQYSEYKNYNHTIGMSFRKVTDAFNFSAGVELLPQRTVLDYKYMGTEYPTITRNVFNFAPNVDFRYNFNKQTNLRFFYRGRTSQPNIINLLDITDDSDPLNISKGNPGLKPSFSHNLRFNFNTFQMEHMRGIFAWGGATMTRNSISNRTYYNEATGVRTTKPENINGNWNAYLGGGFNMSLDKNNYFSVNNFTRLNYSHDVSYLDPTKYEDDRSKTNTLGVNENLGFSFRKDWFEMSINGGMEYNHSRNSVITTGNLDTWSFSYGTEFNFNFDNGFSISTDLSESSRRGYASASMNTNEFLWNAQVSKSFLKGNALTISLQWNDILKNRSNISRAIDAYQSSDSRYNAIYSYGMLHVIYKLNIFAGKNAHGTGNERTMSDVFRRPGGGGGRR